MDDRAAVERLKHAHQQIKNEIHKVIVGQEQVVEELLLAVFSRGHCILEGVPGLAKTLLVSTLARSLNLSFNRIQFTPDLMSQATWQMGDKYWNQYYTDIKRYLLRTQQGNGSWHGDHVGQTYGSAIGLLILQLPYSNLPILSR